LRVERRPHHVDQLVAEFAEHAARELGVLRERFEDDRRQLALLQGEADDAPGEAGAIEVARDQPVVVSLERGRELQAWLPRRRRGLRDERRPRRLVDPAGRVCPDGRLELAGCGLRDAPVETVGDVVVEPFRKERALHGRDEDAATASRQQRSRHSRIPLVAFQARLLSTTACQRQCRFFGNAPHPT
jgi:hypothetical protein